MADDASRSVSAHQRRPPATSTCDCDAFVARLDGDVRLARQMALAFVADAPRLVRALTQAIAARDADGVRRAAHAIKGAAMNFDAVDTVAAAARLERAAQAGDLTEAPALAGRIEAAAAQLVAALSEFGGSSSCAS